MKNKDILFLSLLIPQHMEQEVSKKSRNMMQDAAVVLQRKIIEGIESNLRSMITIYNTLPIFSFPRNYNSCFIRTTSFSHKTGSKDLNVGFINLQYVKQLFQGLSLGRYVKKWVSSRQNSSKIIFVYTLRDDLLTAVKKAKNLDPNVICCAIVADIPDFISLSSNDNKIMQLYEQWCARSSRKLLKYIDCYVLLTEHMATYLEIDKPYLVMEGIASDDFIKIDSKTGNDKIKIIFYAGTLHKKFGIVSLLNAFKLIPDKNYRLVICGIGDSVKTIKERANVDKRIQYLGQIPRNEVLNHMRRATVLVNPRQNNEIFTKYSFPSKNMESLSSGVPLVAYKLDGIPNEYDDYIEYVEGTSINELKNKLMQVCEMNTNELHDKGTAARNFVLSQKNSRKQGEKILRLIESIL